MILHVAVSLLTPEELTEEKARLVWANPLDALRSPGWRGIGNYKVLTAALIICLIVVYALLA